MTTFQRMLFDRVAEMRGIKRRPHAQAADVYINPEFAAWSDEDKLAYVKILIDNAKCEPQKRFCAFILERQPHLDQYYEMLLSDEEFYTKVWHDLLREVNNREADDPVIVRH